MREKLFPYPWTSHWNNILSISANFIRICNTWGKSLETENAFGAPVKVSQYKVQHFFMKIWSILIYVIFHYFQNAIQSWVNLWKYFRKFIQKKPRPQKYQSDVRTRETRVTRLSGKIKIMLLFGFYHECLYNQPLVSFKTLYCLNYNGVKKWSVTEY